MALLSFSFSFIFVVFFFFKQKTAYEMRISDWSSDVCSSDLRSRPAWAMLGHRHPFLPPTWLFPKFLFDAVLRKLLKAAKRRGHRKPGTHCVPGSFPEGQFRRRERDKGSIEKVVDHINHIAIPRIDQQRIVIIANPAHRPVCRRETIIIWVVNPVIARSEEHTSALQSLMRTSYAVF